MKEYLLELIARCKSNTEANLLVREYLQARILEALQRAGAFESWAFLGGTALRFLYRLSRFSEDLDFSRTFIESSHEVSRDEFQRFMAKCRKALQAEAYQVEVRDRPDSVVQSASISFPGLLHELGLSPHGVQNLSIKVEIDTNPPLHATTTVSIVRRHVLLNLLHYDKPSLLAGKLHALLNRSYSKGRDVYDLMWYLSDSSWPEPNLAFLQASLAQTGMTMSDRQVANWRSLIGDRIAAMDWDLVIADVSPFLERSEELAMLNRENVLGLLRI